MSRPVLPDTENAQATILVVDDTEPNRLLCLALFKGSYRVLLADSGRKCLEIARNEHPDLILLDVMMPGMDGYETARGLKNDPALCDTPFIFMTGLTDNESQVKGLELGAVDFVTKPFNFTILGQRVENTLERERMRQAAVHRELDLARALAAQQELSNTLLRKKIGKPRCFVHLLVFLLIMTI